MDELQNAYLNMLALRKDKDNHMPAYRVARDALDMLGQQVIPEREIQLIEIGLDATCCCNNGIGAVELWCKLQWPNHSS